MPVANSPSSNGIRADIDVAAVLAAIAPTTDDLCTKSSALWLQAVAGAAARAAKPSGISVVRTFFGITRPFVTNLKCPWQQVLLTVALADGDARVSQQSGTLFDGRLLAGTSCITEGRQLEIRSFHGCDLLHLAIPTELLRRRGGQICSLDGLVVRDALIGRIGWLLGEAPSTWLSAYADLLSQLVVIRILQLAPGPVPSKLPAWRLKRVEAFVEASMAAPLRLGDLAMISGLSRMHFAAQFRAATGLRPHAYVLSRRIERAKALMTTGDTTLVQVALDSGFQSQAHFCTVFKRLTGFTPSAWQRQQRCEAGSAESGIASARRMNPTPAAALHLKHFPDGSSPLRPAAHLM